jgi:AcrR family transcriptional regulator
MVKVTIGAGDSKRQERTSRRREQTRTEILDVARDLVVTEGLAGFSLAAIAEELGLTKPALYYYFKSKEALIIDIFLHEWFEAASEVEAAVNETDGGADAIEALMRTVFNRYRDQLDLFFLCFRAPTADIQGSIGSDELERIRPINDMLYAGAAHRLQTDKRTGAFPKKRDPRRFAFSAHTAVIGLLSMKAMTESSGDPLLHSDDDLIDDVCQTYRDAALQGTRK